MPLMSDSRRRHHAQPRVTDPPLLWRPPKNLSSAIMDSDGFIEPPAAWFDSLLGEKPFVPFSGAHGPHFPPVRGGQQDGRRGQADLEGSGRFPFGAAGPRGVPPDEPRGEVRS